MALRQRSRRQPSAERSGRGSPRPLTDGQVRKLSVVRSHREIVLSLKKEGSSDTGCSTDEP